MRIKIEDVVTEEELARIKHHCETASIPWQTNGNGSSYFDVRLATGRTVHVSVADLRAMRRRLKWRYGMPPAHKKAQVIGRITAESLEKFKADWVVGRVSEHRIRMKQIAVTTTDGVVHLVGEKLAKTIAAHYNLPPRNKSRIAERLFSEAQIAEIRRQYEAGEIDMSARSCKLQRHPKIDLPEYIGADALNGMAQRGAWKKSKLTRSRFTVEDRIHPTEIARLRESWEAGEIHGSDSNIIATLDFTGNPMRMTLRKLRDIAIKNNWPRNFTPRRGAHPVVKAAPAAPKTPEEQFHEWFCLRYMGWPKVEYAEGVRS